MTNNEIKTDKEQADNILKIDLDKLFLSQAIYTLKNRLSYMNDIGFLYAKNIDKIEILKKARHGARIFLNINIHPKDIIILQLMLGSDYRKEVNTYLNKFKLNMKYYNRLFTTKRYNDGKVLNAKILDVTSDIKEHILDNKRFRHSN